MLLIISSSHQDEVPYSTLNGFQENKVNLPAGPKLYMIRGRYTILLNAPPLIRMTEGFGKQVYTQATQLHAKDDCQR